MGVTTTLIAYLAEKERIKCVKGSKVKLFGNDVVGSYKILLASVLMPITCAIHSFLLYFILKRKTTLSAQSIMKLSVGLFILQPIYALIFVKSYDSFKRSFERLKGLFLMLFKGSFYEDFNREKK